MVMRRPSYPFIFMVLLAMSRLSRSGNLVVIPDMWYASISSVVSLCWGRKEVRVVFLGE